MSASAGIILLLGRILFSLFFWRAGWGHLKQQEPRIGYARAMQFPIPYLAGWPSGIWLVAGAASVSIGIWPDLGALMIGIFVIPAGLWFHRYWTVEDPNQKMVQTQLFFRNVITVGTSLALFASFATFGDALRFTVTGPLFSL
jgi:uncharacterized membrane protein YphA (DoxX/SURF4 family)